MVHDLKKRYWVFGIEEYYPSGGVNDIEGTFDDLEEAKDFSKGNHKKYFGSTIYEIWDMEERIEIKPRN